MSLTETQERTLAIIPKFTASLSIPAAILLLMEIWYLHKQKEGSALLRAVAGISLFACLDAFGWFLSTWAVPEGSFAFAAGNQASCSFQGYLLQVVIASPMYNCALTLYFFLIIKYNVEPTVLDLTEKYVHMFIVIYAVGTSFLLLILGQFNHIGTVCWVNGSPPLCGNSVYQPEDAEALPCDRGDWAWLYGMVLFYIPLWICILVILILNISMSHELHSLDEAGEITKLSLLYALAFCVTWAPSTTWSGLHWNDGGSFWLDLAAAFFEPLACFWNLLIFLRNRPESKQRTWNRLTFGLLADDIGKENDSNTSGMERAPVEI